MANGIARLSPHYCCDPMRWWSLGYSEAQWWDYFVLSNKCACRLIPCYYVIFLLLVGMRASDG